MPQELEKEETESSGEERCVVRELGRQGLGEQSSGEGTGWCDIVGTLRSGAQCSLHDGASPADTPPSGKPALLTDYLCTRFFEEMLNSV